MAPNSSKKRRPEHAFSRATPTPSHVVKMSGIFQNAAVSLEACYTSPTASSPNMKKMRTPIRQARMGPFGQTGRQDCFSSPQAANSPRSDSPPASVSSKALTPTAIPYGSEFPSPLPTRRLSYELHSKPISSGDEAKEPGGSSLIRQVIAGHRKTDDVTYPKLNQWKMRGLPSVPSSLSSDCHSSHGVPVVIPISSTSHNKVEVIDTWLSEVYEPAKSPGSVESTGWVPQSPHYQSWAPQSPGADTQQQQGYMSKNFTLKSSPKRPPTAFSSPPNPLVVLKCNGKAGVPMPALSSNKENSHPFYPILPCSGATPPSINRRSTPSPPPNHSRLSPQSLCPFPMCKTFHPPMPSGPPTPHAGLMSSLSPRILSNTGKVRHKRTRVKSPSDIPIISRSANRLTDQINSSDEEEGAPVKELSPHVERYRKGYGPQQRRRPSYWDRDILRARANGEGDGDDGDDEATVGKNKGKRWDNIGDGRKVMGKSEHIEDLTKPKMLVGGGENVKLGLRA